MMRLGREFIDALETLAEQRGLDFEAVINVIESALLSAYNKYQPSDNEMEVKINIENGDVIISEIRKIVETVEDKNHEISLNDALDYDQNAEVGQILRIEREPKDFSRIAAQTARQVITQKLRDEERKVVYSEFADRIGDMVIGTIYKVEGDDIVVRINDKTDAELPRRERIYGEYYNPGSMMKFYVLDVKQKSRGPRITVSRTHPGLLKKLMELEIPEIQQGIIEIKGVVRDAGARAKVSLVSLDPNVDPVGACIGNGGARIKAVSSQLKGEKVDVVIYSTDPAVYIKNALLPAQISRIEPSIDNEKEFSVYVYKDQLSLAIGKAGQNVRLAAKLTGFKINVLTVEPDKMPTLKDIFHDVFTDNEK